MLKHPETVMIITGGENLAFVTIKQKTIGPIGAFVRMELFLHQDVQFMGAFGGFPSTMTLDWWKFFFSVPMTLNWWKLLLVDFFPPP
jgi:hypothetical protein